MKKKYMKLVGLMMALGLSLGVAACGGGNSSSTASENTSSSVSSSVETSSASVNSSVEASSESASMEQSTESSVETSSESASSEQSSQEEQKVGNYTAASWSELVALSSFENCTVEFNMTDPAGSGLTESSKHLFAADGYSRTGNRNVLGGVNGVDLKFATEDVAAVESGRAALLGFLAEISFDEITYSSSSKAYLATGEFYTVDGKTYKDAAIKVKNGKVDSVAVILVTAEATESQTFKFTKYGSTTPDAPQA